MIKETAESIVAIDGYALPSRFFNRFFGMKRKKVLLFFPHNLANPRTGAHLRALHVLSCFKDIGLEVYLFSTTIFSDVPWDRESVEKLRNEYGINVYIHKGTRADFAHLSMCSGKEEWEKYTPPDMLKAFSKIAAKYNPEFLFVNYALWGGLATAVPSIPMKIIEMHDLITLNGAMQQIVWSELGASPIDPYQVADAVLDESRNPTFGLSAADREFQTYDKFDVTIAISPQEQAIVAAQAGHTKVFHIPMAFAPNTVNTNDYSGAPVFVIGNNVFNFQGYAFFVRRTLSQLLERHPGFSLDVLGDGCNYLKGTTGVRLNGFIADLSGRYRTAPFAICPLLAGTGQQVKVIEAMSFGVPVVAMKNIAFSSPIEHGVNGYVANTADEFAEYCSLLYENRELCRELGDKARLTISEEYSVAGMRKSLAYICNLERADGC